MFRFLLLIFLFISLNAASQSKSISHFRSDYPENSNTFFYRSTLKMLNTDNNPELADLINGIEEIRILNYDKTKQNFTQRDIAALKANLKEEQFNDLMIMNQQGNSINLYSKEKRGKTVGFVAIIENKEELVLLDLIGSIDVKKFMELKQKIDSKL